MKRLRDAALLVAAAFGWDASPALAAGPFLEQDGQVVVEVERAPATGSWEVSQSIAGYKGSSYYRWDGANQSQGGNGLLTYEVRIQHAGNYQIMLRGRITVGSDNKEHNDTFVSMSGTPVSGQFSVGKNAWTKAYQGQLNRWTWQTATKDFDPKPIRQHFDAGLHTIRLSGRSNGHAVDRFILFKYEDKPYENNFSPNTSQVATLDNLDESPIDGGEPTTTTTTTTTTSSSTTTTTDEPPTTTTVVDETTTTTLGETPLPGDLNDDGEITSADALLAARAAVGSESCEPCICDLDGSGRITVVDALTILRIAVGEETPTNPPSCS